MIRIEVDGKAAEQAVAEFGATMRQVELARSRALRKTGAWLRGQVLDQAAKQLRIPRRAMVKRFFLSRVGWGDEVVTLTIGTYPVDISKTATPSQTPRGTRVGRRFYPGAFVGQIYTNIQKVWIRKGSRHYDPDKYPTMKRSGDRFAESSLKGRFPVVRAAVPIDQVVEQVAGKQRGVIANRYLTLLRQELNYEVFVRGAK